MLFHVSEPLPTPGISANCHGTFIRFLTVLMLTLPSVAFTHATPVSLSFEVPYSTPCTDGSAYMAAAGITITGQASARICRNTPASQGGGWTAVDGTSFLSLDTPLPTNSTYSYRFEFATPVNDISFFRVTINAPSTGPAWTASALDAGGNVLSSVSEGITFGPPAQQFFLPGQGIKTIAWTSNTPPRGPVTCL